MNPYLTKLIRWSPQMRLHLDTIQTHNANAYVGDMGMVFINFGSVAGGTFLCGTVEEAEKLHATLGEAIAQAHAQRETRQIAEQVA